MKIKGKITQGDYIIANRRASRKEELELHGRPAAKHKVHRSKKVYDRKREKAGLKKDLPLFFGLN